MNLIVGWVTVWENLESPYLVMQVCYEGYLSVDIILSAREEWADQHEHS